MLEVPRGSKACVQIEDSNLLLYDYAIESKTITIATAEGYDAILAGVGRIVGIPAAAAAAARAPGAPASTAENALDSYTAAIRSILAAGKQLDSLKKASDKDSINYNAADVVKGHADQFNTRADSIFEENRANAAIQLLRSVQASAIGAANALYKEFSEARARGAPQHCSEIKGSAVHVTLKATRKQPSDQRLRPVGDIAGFDVEPVNEKQFEVLPVGIVTFAVPGAKKFYLDSEKRVQERLDRGAFFPAVGALAAFRLLREVWVGAAVAKGQTGTPDSFVGFVFRNPSIARFFVLGIGAGFASVPTDLQEGATINNPLPANADIAKVIKRTTHVGLSILVAMTGLSLSK